MPREDSLSRRVGRARRRLQRNLSEWDVLSRTGLTGDEAGDDTGTTPTGDAPNDPGPTPDDCGGGTGCEELAALEVCSDTVSGTSFERQIGCVVDVLDKGWSEGDVIAWAADVKLETAAGEEVNETGTLKKGGTGLLLRDPLDTLNNLSVENGTATVENGKLRISADNTDVLVTGISPRAEIVAQVRKQSGTLQWADPFFSARLTDTLDGYSADQTSIQDSLTLIDGGLFDSQLDVFNHAGGEVLLTGYRTVLKIHVKDGEQSAKFNPDGQTYELSATDTTHNGQLGTAGWVDRSGGDDGLYWDLILCPNDVITVSGLPTGFSIRVGVLSAAESSGTATLDLEGTIYPSPFPLEVLDASGDPADSWMPPSGIFGGDSFVYDAGGTLTADPEFDAAGQIDLDIFDSAGTLIQTAVTGQTWSFPTYNRLAGTVELPPLSRFLAQTLRANGTADYVVCGRRVAIRKGLTAPWFPCDEVPGGGGAPCGAVPILNDSFESGAYWGLGEFTNDSSINSTSPTFGAIDIEFSAGFGDLDLRQVESSATNFDKPATLASTRYFPVCPGDTITVVGDVRREGSGVPFDSGLAVYIEYYDANKQLVGGEWTTEILVWPQGTESSSLEYRGDGRRQTEILIGEPSEMGGVYGRTEDDFFTRITKAQALSIRFVSFHVYTFTNANATTVGIRYLDAYLNIKAIDAHFKIDLLDGMTAFGQGDEFTAQFVSDTRIVGKWMFSLHRWPKLRELDFDESTVPTGLNDPHTGYTGTIFDYIGETNWFPRHVGDDTYGLHPIPFGCSIYASMLPTTHERSDPATNYDEGFTRRAGPLIRVKFDYLQQIDGFSGVAGYEHLWFVRDPAGSAPEIDMAYGERWELHLDQDCSPTLILSQPDFPTFIDVEDAGGLANYEYDYVGDVKVIHVFQDSTPRAFTWPSNVTGPDGSPPAVTQAAFAHDVFTLEVAQSDPPQFFACSCARNINGMGVTTARQTGPATANWTALDGVGSTA